jgi:outer membrane protein
MKMTTGLMALALLVGSLPALAAEKGGIAYVNLPRVMTDSKPGQRNRIELEKLAKDKQGALQKEEQKLKSLQQDFQKNQLLLTDQQKQQKQQEFQAKVEAFQKMQNEARQALSKREGELVNKSMTDIRAIAKELAKEQQYSMVIFLPDSAVLHVDESIDLTAKTIERYNAKAK